MGNGTIHLRYALLSWEQQYSDIHGIQLMIYPDCLTFIKTQTCQLLNMCNAKSHSIIEWTKCYRFVFVAAVVKIFLWWNETGSHAHSSLDGSFSMTPNGELYFYSTELFCQIKRKCFKKMYKTATSLVLDSCWAHAVYPMFWISFEGIISRNEWARVVGQDSCGGLRVGVWSRDSL